MLALSLRLMLCIFVENTALAARIYPFTLKASIAVLEICDIQFSLWFLGRLRFCSVTDISNQCLCRGKSPAPYTSTVTGRSTFLLKPSMSVTGFWRWWCFLVN